MPDAKKKVGQDCPGDGKNNCGVVTAEDTLRELIQKLVPCDTTVSIDQFSLKTINIRNLADELDEIAESYAQEVALLNRRRETASSEYERLKESRWLIVPSNIEEILGGLTKPSIGEYSEFYRAANAAFSEITSYSDRLDEAARRLRRKQEIVANLKQTSLENAAQNLRQQVEAFSDELAGISKRESEIAEVLDLVSELTPSESLRVLAETTQEVRTALFQYVAKGRPLTEDGQRFERICGSAGLAGQLLRFAWPQDPGDVDTFLTQVAAAFEGVDTATAAQLIAYLDLGQIYDVLRIVPNSFASVGCVVLLDSIIHARPTHLMLTLPNRCKPLSPTCTAVFEEFQHAAQRQQFPHAVALFRATLHGSWSKTGNDVEELKSDLLDFTNSNPGLTKHYHELRLSAQQHFLKPLRKIIDSDDFAKAIQLWEKFGDLDRKVEETVRLSDIHRGIVGSHRDQTRRYLEVFESKLFAWADSRRNSHNWHGEELHRVIQLIFRDSSDLSRQWGTSLRSAFSENSYSSTAVPLGESCSARNGNLILLEQNLVTPFLILSWTAYCSGRPITLEEFLTDLLRISLGRGAKDEHDVVHMFIEAGEFSSAVRAGEDFDSDVLKSRAIFAANEKRRDTEERFNVILAEAKEARLEDEYVELQMLEVDQAFADLRFDEACRCIEQLDGLLAEFRNRRHPAFLRCLQFLNDANETAAYGESLQDLQCRIDALRHANSDKREHLKVLSESFCNLNLPVELSSQFRQLVDDYDRPGCWLNEMDSLLLATGIIGVTGYLSNRLTHGGDVITESLPYWMYNQLEACFKEPEENRTEIIAAFVQIADDIAKPGFPEQRLKEILGVGAVSHRSEIRKYETASQRTQMKSSTSPYQAPDANVVVRDLREWLEPAMRAELPKPEATEARLRSAVRNLEWHEAKQYAAAIAGREGEGRKPGYLNFGEAVYAMCLALGPTDDKNVPNSDKFLKATLAVTCSDRNDLRQVFSSEFIQQFLAWCFAHVTGSDIGLPSDKKLPEAFTTGLTRLSALDDSGTEFSRITTLFANANRVVYDEIDGCAFLAEMLWEVVKGVKDAAKPRSDLLVLLFRLRRYEAIDHLVRQVAATIQDEIRSLLQVVQRLSADPALYQTAAQRFLALRERSSGKSNTRPWIRLFEQLLSVTRQPEEPLTIGLESEYVVPDGEGNMLIEIELRPSVIDPPHSLSVEFSEISSSVTLLEGDQDFLTGPRVITVCVPKEALQAAGDQARIAYRITGCTLLDRSIDVRGVWELQVSHQRFLPIDPMRMTRSWPGSQGSPVQADRGFHGRTKEIERIEGYLMDPNHARSVMLYGQRRIGKTSLLLQMIHSLPPQQGHVCGVFVDLQGLHIADHPGAMQAALFQKIVRDIETKDCNERVNQCIFSTCGKKLNRLVSGIEPESSLSGAIEELVRLISDATNGKINRMAFFIDEFDRFVEPMLAGREEEVELLLWSLRTIVQQSERISLIFAGSGLQRVFTDQYQQAFYGSIDEIEIGTFRLDSDRPAIEDTFLPIAVRSDLCSEAHRKQVVERAYKLTGGHPYFLAMLGCSSAQIANGHMLTPALLNRVVERMIRGDVSGVTCQKFYGHIFESLKYLPLEQQHAATIILCRIALHTTSEHPWIKRMEAIAEPSLLKMKNSTKLEILRRLANENAIENDDNLARVRLCVPVTAAALRHNGERLKQEAVLQFEELRSEKR